MTHRISGLTPFLSVSIVLAAMLALLVGTLPLWAGDGSDGPGGSFSAALAGSQEVPPVATGASGEFELTLMDANAMLYTISYRGIEGGDASVAHIHIGDPGANGSVIIPLCGVGGKPACPSAGTVSGTITAADVMVNANEGLAAGDLEGALRFIRSGRTYANVHNPQNPGGHIRGQISGS